MSDPAGDELLVGSESPSTATGSTALEGPDAAAGSSVKRITKTQNDTSAKKSKQENSPVLLTVEGQLAQNPKLSQDDAKFQAKREYHRQNAARSRLRNKVHVESLQHQVDTLSNRAENLKRENEVLKGKLHVLLNQQQQPQQPRHHSYKSHVQMLSSQALQQDFSKSVLALLQVNQAGSMLTTHRESAPALNIDSDTAAAQFVQAFLTEMQQQQRQQLQQQQQQYQQTADAMNQLQAMLHGHNQRHSEPSQIPQGSIQTSNNSGYVSSNQQQQQTSSEQLDTNIEQHRLSEVANQQSQKQSSFPPQEQRTMQHGLLQDNASWSQEQSSPGSSLISKPQPGSSAMAHAPHGSSAMAHAPPTSSSAMAHVPPGSSAMAQPPGSSAMVQPPPGSSTMAQEQFLPAADTDTQRGEENVSYQEGQQQQMEILLQQIKSPMFAQLLSQISPETLGKILVQLDQVARGNNQNLNNPPS